MTMSTSNQNKSHSKSPLTTLPPELLLQIIPQIPHSPRTLRALHQTSPALHALLTTHESILVPAIRQTSYAIPPDSATSSLFPSLPLKTYEDLETLHGRLGDLDALHENWLHLTSHGPELGWLKERWEMVHKAGTLLLWRLGDVADFAVKSIVEETKSGRETSRSEETDGTTGTASQAEKEDLATLTVAQQSHAAKSDLLHLLPATSLACLVFKCYSAVKILRVHGPDPVNSRCGWEDAGFRCEVELAVEELLLVHGADFFGGLLEAGTGGRGSERGSWAVDALQNELAQMEARQLSPTAQPTLISSLRRSFAAKTNGHIGNTATKMWEILSSSVFDEVDGDKMGKLVGGEKLEGGWRRMGY